MDPDPYDFNSTHCVQAYELRRRGMDVEATCLPEAYLPGRSTAGGRALADIERAWDIRFTSAEPREIVRAFGDFRPGARGIVAVLWRFGGGHVFSVENVGGQIHFVDPQTGDADVSHYFEHAGWTAYARTDDATPGSGVLEFVEREAAS